MGWSAPMVAVFIGLVGLLSVLSQLCLGILMRSLGSKHTIMLGLVFEMLQLLWYGFGTNTWMMWAAGMLASISSITYPAISAFVSIHSHADKQGVVQGMVTGMRGLCNGLGPAMFGIIFYLFHVDLNEESIGNPTHSTTVHMDAYSQMVPGPPFVFGALLVICALLVAAFIPVSTTISTSTEIPTGTPLDTHYEIERGQKVAGNGERTKDKMYETIEGAAACFRRLNSTHQTGCTSNRPGSTGVIHIINNDEDLEFVLKKGKADPYMPVLPIDKLSPTLIRKLKQNPNRIAGVIVHKNISRPSNFSHEAQCPNQLYGLPNTCSISNPVNPYGTGMLLEDFPFPIFLVQDNENLEKIEKCFEKFNNFDKENQNLRSLCSLELASFMFAAVNSQTCIRRSNSVTNFTPTQFCHALGDRNVWSTVKPWLNKTDVVLVTARMDTTSFFNEVTPGAESPLTGLITLLSTAYVMRQMMENVTNINKNIFFILFNGESYDYIGSQRFVYDILNKKFPMERDDNIKNQLPQLSLSDIKLIVELGQLNSNHSTKLYTHHIKYNTSNELTKFKKILNKYSKIYKLDISDGNSNNLPPASLQTFLLENENIEGLILTDHQDEFTNHYYNSIFDDQVNIQYTYFNKSDDETDDLDTSSIQAYIGNISKMLGKSLYEEITGTKYNGNEIPVAHIVDELFHCYLDTADCKLYQAITGKEHIGEKPLSLYVGVEGSSNLITALTGLSLAWLTGDVTDIAKDNCTGDPHDPAYQYIWMSKNLTDANDTVCFKTTMNFTLAVSPAFIIDDYDWNSKKYSTWTESVWKDLYVRMYLKPSARHEIMTFSVGSATFVLSMALVYFVKTRSDILFARLEAASGTSC